MDICIWLRNRCAKQTCASYCYLILNICASYEFTFTFQNKIHSTLQRVLCSKDWQIMKVIRFDFIWTGSYLSYETKAERCLRRAHKFVSHEYMEVCLGRSYSIYEHAKVIALMMFRSCLMNFISMCAECHVMFQIRLPHILLYMLLEHFNQQMTPSTMCVCVRFVFRTWTAHYYLIEIHLSFVLPNTRKSKSSNSCTYSF